MDSKVWYASKQLWVAAIALIATGIQAKYGFVVSPEYQGYAVTIIMLILRLQPGGQGPLTLTKQ